MDIVICVSQLLVIFYQLKSERELSGRTILKFSGLKMAVTQSQYGQ